MILLFYLLDLSLPQEIVKIVKKRQYNFKRTTKNFEISCLHEEKHDLFKNRFLVKFSIRYTNILQIII